MVIYTILSIFLLSICVLASEASAAKLGPATFGYGKAVLMDLCQYVGVQYIRNPDNPECGYIACWDRRPYHMPCAPGVKVHRLFFWGSSYPCTETDSYGRCDYVKNFLMGEKATPLQKSDESQRELEGQLSSLPTYDDTGIIKGFGKNIVRHGSGGPDTKNRKDTPDTASAEPEQQIISPILEVSDIESDLNEKGIVTNADVGRKEITTAEEAKSVTKPSA